MKLALFTNGKKTILGTNNDRSLIFNSLILFQDPDLFTKRLIFILKNRLELHNFAEIENFVIALPGPVDGDNNTLKESYILNNVSRLKRYNGFNFNEALINNFQPNQISVLNDSFIVALGVCNKISEELLPCLVLTMDDGIGVSFVNNTKSVMTTEWGGDYIPKMNRNSYNALEDEFIISLLMNGQIDINKQYTDNLINSVEYLAQKYSQNNPVIKSVFILGEKTQYIDPKHLSDNLPNFEFSIITDENLKKEIILQGCFAYSDYLLSQNYKVLKIQYFSGLELIYDFENFANCLQHYISAKPICNPENYYKIFFSDDSIKLVSMKEINDVTDLELYRF